MTGRLGGKKSTGCPTVRLELCSVSDLWRLAQKAMLFTFRRLPFKRPRQVSLPARQVLPRDQRGKRVPSIIARPFPPGDAGQSETPGRTRRLFQGRPPRERSPKLLGGVSGAATLPPCSPGTSAGPPARLTGPSPGYLVLAAAPAALLAA